MVHGVQHNCGSFNRLIPSLKNDVNVVAIDLPSHGLSSHFPPGAPLELILFVLALKRVLNYLKWDVFSLVGHSFGGQICTYFTALFPQGVQSLVVIDTMEPRQVLLQDTLPYLQGQLENQLILEEKLSTNSPPIYTYEQAYEKVKRNDKWELTDEAAKDLIERAINQFNGGYTFRYDQRLKYPMRPVFTFEQQIQIVDNITCPVLYILGDGNMARYDTYLKEIYEFNTNRENTTVVIVKGDHAVHQNYPERVGPLIDEFLTTKNLNESTVGLVRKEIMKEFNGTTEGFVEHKFTTKLNVTPEVLIQNECKVVNQ